MGGIQIKQLLIVSLLLVPEYLYRVSLHSPLSSVNKFCRAVFSVSLYHEVFIKVSGLALGGYNNNDSCIR